MPDSSQPHESVSPHEPVGQPEDPAAAGDTSGRRHEREAESFHPGGGHETAGGPAEGSDAGQVSAAAAETRDAELERLRAEIEMANKHALQAQAEAENFRRRMRRDYEDQVKYAAIPLVSDLLEVRDNLYRAIDAADSSQSAAGLRDGVVMCAKQLDHALSKHGVTEIPAEGEEFDPNVHEAISQVPSEEVEAGRVAHVAQVGFQLHDRVIRPSQVVVSAGPPQ